MHHLYFGKYSYNLFNNNIINNIYVITEEWNNMPQTVIQSIILSMRRRCTACINARGGHTRY
jgi:hypothetical protein